MNEPIDINSSLAAETPLTPKSAKRKICRWLLIGLLVIVLGGMVLMVFDVRDVGELKTKNPTETALMRFRARQAGETTSKPSRRLTWIPLSAIDPSLIQAVLIAEDDKFFQHEGFDWQGIKTAMEKNIDRKRWAAGGSTITQQLAKNLYLSPSRNPLRKLREAALAIQMEKALSKKRILEIYLNVIEWGRGIYGVGPAARHYFNKSPSELTVSESIRLASVLPNPLRYSPLRDDNKRMRKQRRLLTERLYKRHAIDDSTFTRLYEEFSASP